MQQYISGTPPTFSVRPPLPEMHLNHTYQAQPVSGHNYSRSMYHYTDRDSPERMYEQETAPNLTINDSIHREIASRSFRLKTTKNDRLNSLPPVGHHY